MSTTAKLILPRMGCGTWAWGNRLLWGYDESMDSQLQAVFNLCVSEGVTLFDTGDSYGTGKLNGQSEKLLGKFDQEYRGVNKDNICLATKLAAYPW
ncbi:MAG: aldo/keto reductase, partial [Waterburya sp.]